jgi:hypothetical protein
MTMRVTVLLTCAVLPLVVATTASAHVKTDQGNWLFTGSTYNPDNLGRSPDPDLRSDPVSVVWRGPSGATATLARAMDHTEQHWRDRRIPDRYPNGAFMRPRHDDDTEAFCRDPQLIFYRDGNQANSGAWSQSRAYMSTNHLCGNQYHVRMWSSAIHGGFFPGGDHTAEWVIAPIHHERLALQDPTGGDRPTRHIIDLPWDQARSVYMHTIGAVHCIDRGWQVHPESEDHQYGDIRMPYSGIVSRISFRHRSEGCDGA